MFGELEAGAIETGVVEDLGLVAVDADEAGRLGVQVGPLRLATLQGHPAIGRPTYCKQDKSR